MKIKLIELTRNFNEKFVQGTYERLAGLGHSFLKRATLLQQQVSHLVRDWSSIQCVNDANAKMAKIPVQNNRRRFTK